MSPAPKAIASRDNAVYKALLKLARDGATRREQRLALLEGVHLCKAYLDSGGTPSQCALAHSSIDHPEVRALLAVLAARGPSLRVHALDDPLYAAVSGLEQGVGILFVIEIPQRTPGPSITRTTVLLDRIQDPGNAGSILRSVAAAGIVDVHASPGCAGLWSPKVLRAAMGAHFALAIAEGSDLARLVADAAIPVFATSPHAERTLFDVDLAREAIWIFGHEGQGVAPALMEAAIALSIPQPGQVESLNVAASAAICLFEQVRQRRAASAG